MVEPIALGAEFVRALDPVEIGLREAVGKAERLVHLLAALGQRLQVELVHEAEAGPLRRLLLLRDMPRVTFSGPMEEEKHEVHAPLAVAPAPEPARGPIVLVVVAEDAAAPLRVHALQKCRREASERLLRDAERLQAGCCDR
jgi:hypothetical protein